MPSRPLMPPNSYHSIAEDCYGTYKGPSGRIQLRRKARCPWRLCQCPCWRPARVRPSDAETHGSQNLAAQPPYSRQFATFEAREPNRMARTCAHASLGGQDRYNQGAKSSRYFISDKHIACALLSRCRCVIADQFLRPRPSASTPNHPHTPSRRVSQNEPIPRHHRHPKMPSGRNDRPIPWGPMQVPGQIRRIHRDRRRQPGVPYGRPGHEPREPGLRVRQAL
jgi:hypothetical protein